MASRLERNAMTETLVLMPGDAPRWLRISDGEIVARGEGLAAHDPDDHVVAVVPARDVTIHHADLPDLAEAQARAAARLLVADQSAAPAGTLHVAVGKPNGAGNRPVVAIDRAKMVAMLADMTSQGHDPDVVVAAPMLLARPDTGFVRGDLGGETILRGYHDAFADDPILTPLLTGGAVTVLDRASLERGLVAGVMTPEVDLRQGIFAKRRAWGLDWPRLRRIGWLMLAVAVATLLFQVIQLVRLNMAADRIEANNITIARATLPPGTTVNNPLVQVQEALNNLRGPGGGILPLAAGVASAANATPNLELTSLIFDGGGTLRITARAVTPTDLMIFEAKLKEAGLTSASGPLLVDQGRQVRDFTVSAK
jgi:general secretion pathway protein L